MTKIFKVKKNNSLFVNKQLRLTIKRLGFPQNTLYIRVREVKIYRMQHSIFRYKRPKRAVGALYFYTSSERIARLAPCIEPYFSLQIHASPSWLTVYRHRKCAVTQRHSTAVNTTISTY